MTNHQQEAKLARACTACYEKKIRCNVASGKVPCSSCELHGTSCIPRVRKRKHDRHFPSSFEPGEYVAELRARSRNIGKRRVRQVGSAQPQLELEHFEVSPIPPEAAAQVGYDDYYGSSMPGHRPAEESLTDLNPRISAINKTVLQLFTPDLPTAAWQSSLLENFLTYARPLMPIVDPQWLVSRADYTAPAVLIKAVLLAGARVSEKQAPFSCDEYYSAIKAVLLYSREQNPIISIVVACILGWYNQASTYTVTVDSSSAWLRFASNIAYQIGLHKKLDNQIHTAYRRRLWWTLIARDCQISAGQGRPRIFNLLDCDVEPISVEDFAANDADAEFFVKHVQICLILGDLCDLYRRREISTVHRDTVNYRLLWWLKSLSPEAQASAKNPSVANFMWRQVLVIYFSVVTILYRTEWATQKVHSQALIASSFLASLLEDFLARDEMQRLPTMFAFYTSCAAVPQIVATKFPNLRETAEIDLGVVEEAMVALAARWPSSKSALKHFYTMKASRTTVSTDVGSPTPPVIAGGSNDLMLFEGFDPSACRAWLTLVGRHVNQRACVHVDRSLADRDTAVNNTLAHPAFIDESAPLSKPRSLARSPLANDQQQQNLASDYPFHEFSVGSFTDFADVANWLVFDDPNRLEFGPSDFGNMW